MDQARGPVLQRPLQVEDSIQFLHQRIQECNACLPYTGSSLEYLSSDMPGGMWVCLALPVRLADQVTYMGLCSAYVTLCGQCPSCRSAWHLHIQSNALPGQSLLCGSLAVAGSKALSLVSSVAVRLSWYLGKPYFCVPLFHFNYSALTCLTILGAVPAWRGELCCACCMIMKGTSERALVPSVNSEGDWAKKEYNLRRLWYSAQSQRVVAQRIKHRAV